MKTPVFLFALLLGAANSLAADNPLTPAMCGAWHGQAKIVVNWTRQTNLPVTVYIAPDASVTGKVGDAVLTRARLKSNRSALGRKLNLATDYLITGDLTGPVISAEGINRSSVNIPLNFTTNLTFKGGLHTSGGKFGGRKNMILSASDLTLAPTNSP